MEWYIPGTMLKADKAEAVHVDQQFSSMFLAGGMVLSQVCSITGLEAYAVQNWVKRGFLSPPERKRYSLRQLCRIININMLKNVLPMERIVGLLSYINGDLDDESDDVIDDSQLYFMFVRLAAQATVMNTPQGRDQRIAEELARYREPVPGAKERVEKVLRIMLTAWASAQLRQHAEQMLQELTKKDMGEDKPKD
jgi:DNA-binding transcriptional MerR regulator